MSFVSGLFYLFIKRKTNIRTFKCLWTMIVKRKRIMLIIFLFDRSHHFKIWSLANYIETLLKNHRTLENMMLIKQITMKLKLWDIYQFRLLVEDGSQQWPNCPSLYTSNISWEMDNLDGFTKMKGLVGNGRSRIIHNSFVYATPYVKRWDAPPFTKCKYPLVNINVVITKWSQKNTIFFCQS